MSLSHVGSMEVQFAAFTSSSGKDQRKSSPLRSLSVNGLNGIANDMVLVIII